MNRRLGTGVLERASRPKTTSRSSDIDDQTAADLPLKNCGGRFWRFQESDLLGHGFNQLEIQRFRQSRPGHIAPGKGLIHRIDPKQFHATQQEGNDAGAEIIAAGIANGGNSALGL